MSNDPMGDGTIPADEEIKPRVRTMRAAPPVVGRDADDEPGFQARADDAPRPPTDSEEARNEPEPPEEDDEEEPASPIHGGWTAGQQIIDATSTYAQNLKLGEQVQVIKFLDDQPYANFRRHWVERMTPTGRSNRPYTCLETVGRDCPLCDIADKPQAVAAFNVVLVGDDGQVLLRTWDVGPRLFNVLKAAGVDPHVGPLTRGYFAVNQTGKKQNTQTNVNDKDERWLVDHGYRVPSAEQMAKVGKYDPSIIQIPKRSELEEIAAEIADYE